MDTPTHSHAHASHTTYQVGGKMLNRGVIGSGVMGERYKRIDDFGLVSATWVAQWAGSYRCRVAVCSRACVRVPARVCWGVSGVQAQGLPTPMPRDAEEAGSHESKPGGLTHCIRVMPEPPCCHCKQPSLFLW
jgi:hypothetical protein